MQLGPIFSKENATKQVFVLRSLHVMEWAVLIGSCIGSCIKYLFRRNPVACNWVAQKIMGRVASVVAWQVAYEVAFKVAWKSCFVWNGLYTGKSGVESLKILVTWYLIEKMLTARWYFSSSAATLGLDGLTTFCPQRLLHVGAVGLPYLLVVCDAGPELVNRFACSDQSFRDRSLRRPCRWTDEIC